MDQERTKRKEEAIRRVTARVESAIKRVVHEHLRTPFWVAHYGANHIHPRHLVFWICVKTDAVKLRLKKDKELMKRLRQVLVDCNYPQEGRDGVFIGFESQETVDRVSRGNWWYHWK